MQKIIVTEFFSLDGMMSDPGDTMEWVTGIFNDKEGAYESDMYDRIDTLLLGRTTTKSWAATGQRRRRILQRPKVMLSWPKR